MKWIINAAVAGALLGTLPGMAISADWPDRPIRVVVPYSPGGGVDVFTRPLAAALSKELGQSVVVENRPGAGGIIGVRYAASAEADGYTFLSGGVHQPMAERLYPDRNYDLGKDFTPIALTAQVPTVLVVSKQAPFNSVETLISYAKKNPEKMNYCSSGAGTAQHIVAESFKRLTGLNMTHIPYRGTAPAMTDLIAGQCLLMFDGLGTSAPQIQGGKIRPLAVLTARRSSLFPDIPTIKEAGGPDMDATIWYGWWARAGTSPAIVERMAKAIGVALNDPAVAEAWKQQGAEVPDMSFEDTGPYVRSEISRWMEAVKELGISLN